MSLLCQEAVGACLLEPMQDFLPPFGDVSNCQGERFGLARRLGLDGNVGEGGQGREIERPWGARAVLKDLPNELAFQCFFRQPLVLDPVCTGYGCTMQIGIVGQLAPKKGGKVAQLGDAFSSRAVSALSSMSSGTGSPCHCARSLLWPVVSGWGSHAALTFKVGLGLCCRLRRCGVHNLLTRSATHCGAPPPPKGRI